MHLEIDFLPKGRVFSLTRILSEDLGLGSKSVKKVPVAFSVQTGGGK
jgi:hypothetical protein